MIQSHFDNIESVISALLSIAEQRVYVAVAWFTNKRLSEELINALKRNVKVKVLLLNDILNRSEFGIDFGVLATNGAEIRFANSKIGTMHNKFCIIDDKVITGSYNWTYHANVNNENVIEIDEIGVVNNYCEQFEVLFNSGEPIKKPYEYLKWIDVKEGDFSELRRNIFRDIIANGTEYRELQKSKLIKLDQAYKSGNPEDLARASSLPIEESLRTITDVLVSRSQDFIFNLWEENRVNKPFNDTDGHIYFGKWYYIPYEIKEDKYHQEYIEGTLKTNACRYDIISKGLKLNIYDKDYIETIKKLLCFQPLSSQTRKLIPDKLLRIDFAKICFYQFPSPMYNKSQPKTWRNTPRTIPAINLFAIAKEVNGDNVTFYDGWDPQKRGEKITKEFFIKAENLKTNSHLIEQREKTITDVLTNSTRKYEGELFYLQNWDLDEQPSDVRYSIVGKWIFIPEYFGENKYHEIFVRGYLHFYNWLKKRDNLYNKIQIDIYDDAFISTLSKYINVGEDISRADLSRIPEDLICVNLAKLFICKYSGKTDIGGVQKALAVLCIVKEIKDNNIVYYEGWDPQTRENRILETLRQKNM